MTLLGASGSQQRLEAAIDVLIARAAERLSLHVAHARMRLRELDPLSRLGVQVIQSTLGEISVARACEALEQLDAVAHASWWLAPPSFVDPAADSIVLTAGQRVLAVTACRSWEGAVDRAARAAESLGWLMADGFGVSALVALDGDAIPVDAAWSSGQRRVILTTIDRLADIARSELSGAGPYRPASAPRLTEALRAARHRARLQAAATESLLGELGERWLIAPNVRLRELAVPIGVLVVGPGGLFTCEPAAYGLTAAARSAIEASRHLAAATDGLGVHVTPIVICEAGTRARQLELTGWGRAWLLGVDGLAPAVAGVDRAGVSGWRARRLRRPAPGWQYRVARRGGGWAYEVCYDLARHRPASLGA
jgi:hypothetical protein